MVNRLIFELATPNYVNLPQICTAAIIIKWNTDLIYRRAYGNVFIIIFLHDVLSMASLRNCIISYNKERMNSSQQHFRILGSVHRNQQGSGNR
jgi:hypothetical protein